MSRMLNWYLSEQDLYELFENTFGPKDDCTIMDMEFDPDTGVLKVELLDEISDGVYDGHYTGVRIG